MPWWPVAGCWLLCCKQLRRGWLTECVFCAWRAIIIYAPATGNRPPSSVNELRRDIGLWRGIALNMIDMVGIGPFITIPFILMAMGGGRGMLAWILGGLLAISDGLVTAELSAS